MRPGVSKSDYDRILPLDFQSDFDCQQRERKTRPKSFADNDEKLSSDRYLRHFLGS